MSRDSKSVDLVWSQKSDFQNMHIPVESDASVIKSTLYLPKKTNNNNDVSIFLFFKLSEHISTQRTYVLSISHIDIYIPYIKYNIAIKISSSLRLII